MKIKDACQEAGCAEDMYCFGGKDETMEHQLCPDVIMHLLKSLIEAGMISKKEFEGLLKIKQMIEDKLKE